MAMNGNAVILNTYERLCNDLGSTKVDFENPAYSIVTDDSDHHRSRSGYVCYESAQLVCPNGLPWGVLSGIGTDAYGHEESRDLLIVDLRSIEETEERYLDALVSAGNNNRWYGSSLCWGSDDGMLYVTPKDESRPPVRPFLARKIAALAKAREVTKARYEPAGILLSLRSGAYTYDERLVPELTEVLTQYLRFPFEQ